MARYAQVLDSANIVVNVIMWDGDPANYQPPAGYTMVLDDPPSASPGFTYDPESGSFTAPPSGEPVVKEE